MNKKILIPVWILCFAMFIVSGVYDNPVAGARWIQFGAGYTLVMYLYGKVKKGKQDEKNT